MAYGPSELMGQLIALIDKRWVSVQEVERLIEPLGLQEVVRQVHFYQEIKRLMRLLPTEVFIDDDQRQNLLDVFQSALDKAIEREEDQLCTREAKP